MKGNMHSSVLHDPGLQSTNPVLVIDQVAKGLEKDFIWNLRGATHKLARAVEALSQDGAPLPAFKIDEMKRLGYQPADFAMVPASARPGVLGLVVEPGTDVGYVLPLIAQVSPSGWQVDPMLPFRERDILGALVRLAQVSGHPTAGVLPERLAFSFTNPLGYRTAGNSMTAAAILAVIDALHGRRSELLHCACAVVELGDGGQLQAVRHIRPKLEAVQREYQGGSLLVCVPGCPEAAAFRHRFCAVWEVADLASLAGELHRARLLAPLMRQAPLGQEEFQRVHDHLRWLVETEHDYEQASDLGQRLEDRTNAGATSVTLADTINRLVAAAWRHRGRFVEANAASHRLYHQVQARGPFTSFDERADAAAEYAAALFGAHCFANIPPLLRPWLQEIDEDPQRLRAQTRVQVLNTLGRALVILGEDGWETLFRRSLELQERLNPGDVPRTRSYLIYGLLRRNRLEAAHGEFAALGSLPEVHDFAGRMLRFLRADLARRSDRLWHDQEMDDLTPGAVRPNHPAAFYFQATARQPDRPDFAVRLRRAAKFLRDDGAKHPQNITSLFAHCLELYAAARSGDGDAWRQAADSVRQFLADREVAPLRTHYAPALEGLAESPDVAAAEDLLSLIPFF
jgi:hypothetical protein